MGKTTSLNWWSPDFFHQQYLLFGCLNSAKASVAIPANRRCFPKTSNEPFHQKIESWKKRIGSFWIPKIPAWCQLLVSLQIVNNVSAMKGWQAGAKGKGASDFHSIEQPGATYPSFNQHQLIWPVNFTMGVIHPLGGSSQLVSPLSRDIPLPNGLNGL